MKQKEFRNKSLQNSVVHPINFCLFAFNFPIWSLFIVVVVVVMKFAYVIFDYNSLISQNDLFMFINKIKITN